MPATPNVQPWGEDGPTLPGKWEICFNCNGNGRHVNPAVDGSGLTEDDFLEQGDEFREDYFNGLYDIACDNCSGSGKCLVVDEDRCSAAQWAEYEEFRIDEAESAPRLRAMSLQEMPQNPHDFGGGIRKAGKRGGG